jgi:hypothetical protein
MYPLSKTPPDDKKVQQMRGQNKLSGNLIRSNKETGTVPDQNAGLATPIKESAC